MNLAICDLFDGPLVRAPIAMKNRRRIRFRKKSMGGEGFPGFKLGRNIVHTD